MFLADSFFLLTMDNLEEDWLKRRSHYTTWIYQNSSERGEKLGY